MSPTASPAGPGRPSGLSAPLGPAESPPPGATELARLRQALAVSEAARAAAEHQVRQQARRYELLLSLATLPDLSLEAAPVADEAPPAEAAPPGTPAERRARTRDDALRASLQHLVEVIGDGLGADGAALLLSDRGGRRLRLVGGTGSVGRALAPAPDEAGDRWSADPDLRRVFRVRAPRLWTGTRDERRGVRETESEGTDGRREAGLLGRLGAAALMAAPVVVEGGARGVLLAAGARPDAFAEHDLSFLALVAARLGLLLERAELARAQREVERQRAQATARQQFLSLVTHELKTPVAVQRAYLEVLQARAQHAGRAEEAELLERVDEQAARLLALVEQVLDLQRLDAGLFPLELSRVDLGALARRLVQDLQVANPGVGIRLRLGEAPLGETPGATAATAAVPGAGHDDAGPAERIEVRADRRRIEQALTNLIQNAARFSPAGGEVRVWVRRAGERALVSVSDQGPGVAEEDRGRIFARFYQGQGGATLHRGHSGLGVGLYIAREIVGRHGGALWLEAPPPRGGATGATFTFALPVSGPEEAR